MIIFYDKIIGEIIGTIEGRVHFDHHLNASIPNTERLIIGWIEDKKGNRLPQNMHLWQHQLAWEDARNPRKPHKERVVFNKQGQVIGFVSKGL